MSIKRLLDSVERRGDTSRRVAALALPMSNRPRVTSSCAGKIGLRDPGEHTSGPNLASRDNVAHHPKQLEALRSKATEILRGGANRGKRPLLSWSGWRHSANAIQNNSGLHQGLASLFVAG